MRRASVSTFDQVRGKYSQYTKSAVVNAYRSIAYGESWSDTPLLAAYVNGTLLVAFGSCSPHTTRSFRHFFTIASADNKQTRAAYDHRIIRANK
ncbi:hypothetical protein N7539_004455 [Penicillium diatomitis]|uniref:Uncharacterized protein n=1 Tax=Penicillium diatomitis TaxID=2819901 RepID=A0A9X0BYA0_9EURO|nr:uncharacterized protein N7539_004455 [Penicillium diatomitis]KAJ5489565.1 hypothetical protein N7539_004455 [Penicillium diatomitis]